METQNAAFGRPVKLNIHHIDPEKDKPRNRSMVKMRVENRSTLALQVLENTIGPGVHEISVYEYEVPKVHAMVEPAPQRLKEAEAQYELEIAEAVKARTDMFQGTAIDMLELIKSGASDKVNAEYQRQLEITPLSPHGVFRRMNKRDVLPLVSAEVIEDSVYAEPQRAALDREQNKLADAIGKALAKHSGGAAPADIEARINAMVEAKVAALLGEKTAAKK